jgi:hypothetical protein
MKRRGFFYVAFGALCFFMMVWSGNKMRDHRLQFLETAHKNGCLIAKMANGDSVMCDDDVVILNCLKAKQDYQTATQEITCGKNWNIAMSICMLALLLSFFGILANIKRQT